MSLTPTSVAFWPNIGLNEGETIAKSFMITPTANIIIVRTSEGRVGVQYNVHNGIKFQEAENAIKATYEILLSIDQPEKPKLRD
jgi:hypothetical protein